MTKLHTVQQNDVTKILKENKRKLTDNGKKIGIKKIRLINVSK